jgi:hypothetical protein
MQCGGTKPHPRAGFLDLERFNLFVIDDFTEQIVFLVVGKSLRHGRLL